MARPPSGKRVTIRDVARFARVSHQTVSRFINDGKHRSVDARARRAAITKLGFRLSTRAEPGHAPDEDRRPRHGRRGKPLLPGRRARGGGRLGAGGLQPDPLEQSARSERELRNVRHLLERATDGLILGAPQCPPGDLAELAQRAGVPMVFLNREVAAPTSRPSGSTGRAPRPRSRRTSRSSGIGASPWSFPSGVTPGLETGRTGTVRRRQRPASALSGRWSSARACRSRAGTAPASVCLPFAPGRPQPSVTTT